MTDFLFDWGFGSWDVFRASGHETYAYWILDIYVHVGGGDLLLRVL